MAACRAGFLVLNRAGANRDLCLPLPNNIGLKPEGLGFSVVETQVKDGQLAPGVRSREETVRCRPTKR